MHKRPRELIDLPLEGLKCIIGRSYKGKRKNEIKAAVEKNGGSIVAVPATGVSFLIQSWADDPCDDRLAACCALDIVAVPYEYILHCISEKELTPYRIWAQYGGSTSTFCNPVTTLKPYCEPVAEAGSKAKYCCLLGVEDMGNMDIRCRETEEINQSVHEHRGQKWPSLGEKGRDVVYLQPFATAKSSKPDDVSSIHGFPTHSCTSKELLTACRVFLAAYFGCDCQVLPPLPTQPLSQKGTPRCSTVEVHGMPIRVCTSDQIRKDGVARLYNVLDMLAVLQAGSLEPEASASWPRDAYCLLGITDEFIYEWEEGDDDVEAFPPADDESLYGLMRGRAYGGSHVAVLSTAGYGEVLRNCRAMSKKEAASAFAYQLATMAHETMHCFGLDHCGLYTCCMNPWCDEIREFARPPRPNRKQLKFTDGVVGCLHVCPICVRKLQITCAFELGERYACLRSVYMSLGLEEQAQWCAAVIRTTAQSSLVN